MIIYLMKASAGVALSYLIYLGLFRQTNKPQWNRAYLMIGLLVSFIAPFIVIDVNSSDIMPAINTANKELDSLGAIDFTNPEQSGFTFVPYVYYVGVSVSLLITLISVLKPIKLYMTSDKIVRNGQTIVIHPRIQPFSFFGTLFLRSLDEDPIIIEHEMVHIKQRHWVDLLMIEAAVIVLWFNPIIHLYRRSIIIQHEYAADLDVTKKVSIEAYLNCIATQLSQSLSSKLINGFNTQSIKQRIIMITNPKEYSALRYIIILPLVAVLVMAFATRKTTSIVAPQNNEFRMLVDTGKVNTGASAGFGKRLNPATNSETFHSGVDFVLAEGNDVYAAADGVVINASYSDSYGNNIVIEHSNGLKTSSAHLQRMTVKKGDRVEVGQKIGTVGSTGLSTGPHLHFEVLKDGKAIDPAPYLSN